MNTLFDSMTNITIVCVTIICTVSIIVLAMKRLIHHGIGHKISVITANIAAGLAVIGLATGFYYTSVEPLTIVLVTPNASEQVIDQLNNEGKYDNVHWVALTNASNELSNNKLYKHIDKKDVITISNVVQLSLHYPLLSQIIVLGDGLTTPQWQLLMSQYPPKEAQADLGNNTLSSLNKQSIFIQQLGYTPQLGLVNMQWQDQLVVGQQATITGQLQSANDANNRFYNLSLIGPMNTELETQTLASNDKFSFTITAKIPGQWLYRLKLTERGRVDSSVEEKIGVQVINGNPIKLLIKQSSPSFETRHLQNTIAELGGKVLSLTQISKHKDIRQQINISPAENDIIATPFSPQGIDFFDILLIDQQALSGLSKVQKLVLDQAIQNGLGVLVQAQSRQIETWPSARIKWLNKVNVIKAVSSTNTEKLDYLRWQYQVLDTPITSIKANIEATTGNVLVADENNRPVVLAQEYGLGHVAVSLINSTHIWKTQGNPGLHSHYWQWIFSQIARTSDRFQFQSTPPQSPKLAGQIQRHCLVNTQKVSTLQIVQGALAMPLSINKQLIDANLGCTQYSPSAPGWYSLLAQLKNKGTSSIALYAGEATTWQAWQQTLRREATTNVIADQYMQGPSNVERHKALEPYWFWGLLITSLTILWLERKYFS